MIMVKPMLKTSNLHKYYATASNIVKALNGVSLEVQEGEFVAIMGTSGSGKSTLLHMMGGLDRPTSGVVCVDGKYIFDMTDEELTIFRRRNVGFIFQNYNLVQTLNVIDNVTLISELDGVTPDMKFINELISLLGLQERIFDFPDTLSGGQQQRVAIARALAAKPAIVLADEPTGNLDSKTSLDVIGLLKMTSHKFNQTMIMITHNEEIAQLAERIIRIEDGRVCKSEDENSQQ